jgi:hypothetical protein
MHKLNSKALFAAFAVKSFKAETLTDMQYPYDYLLDLCVADMPIMDWNKCSFAIGAIHASIILLFMI